METIPVNRCGFQFLGFRCVIFKVAIAWFERKRCHTNSKFPLWKFIFPFDVLHFKFPMFGAFGVLWRLLRFGVAIWLANLGAIPVTRCGFQFLGFRCIIFKVTISRVDNGQYHPNHEFPPWTLICPSHGLRFKFPKFGLLLCFYTFWFGVVC